MTSIAPEINLSDIRSPCWTLEDVAAFTSDDVGRRVVVRYLTGQVGPSGGPEMTDVIGHIRAVGEDAITVERRGGELVTVRIADVTAWKVVPER